MTDCARGAGATDADAFWSRLVANQHELPAVLRVIAGRVVELFGDGCVLTVVSDDGRSLLPQAIVHEDDAVQAAMREVLGQPVPIGVGVAGSVAADRRPILLNDLTPDAGAETTPPQFLPFVLEHPMRALMIVPLEAAGDLVGTLGAVRMSSDEPYSATDLRLLEALADRAAVAIAEALHGPRAIGPADYEAIYRHNLDGVLITTPDGHILAANPAACEILGMAEREITSGGRERILVADDPNLAPALTERATSGRARAELTMRRGDDSTFPADVSSTIFTTPEGRVRAVVIFRDITEEVHARDAASARVAALEQAAGRDPLTGLLNRRGFAAAAEQALATADRHRYPTQLVFVDIDGMKRINDERGHSAGDAAIVAVAAAIRRATRDSDVVCRFGGDEFVVLLVESHVTDVPEVIARIDRELDADPERAGPISCSIGTVERLPHDLTGITELIDAADRDMYRNKVLHRLRLGT